MAQPGSWYLKTIFNIHFDHHVGPQTPVGAGADPEKLAALIAPARPGLIQYHSKGHPGWTTYPTDHGGTPPGMVRDALKAYRDAARLLGVKFFVYYSGLKDRYAAEKHPEWRRRNANGGFIGEDVLCPNTGYVEGRVLPQLREIIEKYSPDGFWFDGDCWSVTPCYCSSCCSLFKEKTGREPPKTSSDPLWGEWCRFHRESFVNYLRKCANLIHSLKPDCMFTSNWAYTVRMPDPPPSFIDWISADVTPTHSLRQISLEARFLSARGKPFDLMTALQAFTWSRTTPYPKTAKHLMQEGALIIANGGRWFLWINPLSDDSLDPYHMRIAEECGRFAHERAEALMGTEPAHDVAILHSTTTFYSRGNGVYDYGEVLNPLRGAHQALQELHYLFDIVDEETLSIKISRYKAVVLAEQNALPRKLLDELREYVAGGGSLVVTGRTAEDEPWWLREVVGVNVEEYDGIPAALVCVGEEALPVNKAWHRVRPMGAEELAALNKRGNEGFEPLGYPAATLNRYGRGRVLYVATDLFGCYWHEQYPGLRRFIGLLVRYVLPRSIEVEAPPTVEVTLRRRDRDLIVNLCNLSVGKDLSGNSFYVEYIPPVYNVCFKLRLAEAPKKIRTIPGGQRIEWEYRDGVFSARLRRLDIHVAILIKT